MRALLIVLCAGPAHAYVDPGVVGSFYQVVYVVVLGAVLGFIVTPFKKAAAFLAGVRDGLRRLLRRDRPA